MTIHLALEILQSIYATCGTTMKYGLLCYTNTSK